MKIGILGAGSWGTAMSVILSSLNHELSVYGRNEAYLETVRKTRVSSKYLPEIRIPDEVEFSSDMKEVIKGKDVIILAVTSQTVRKVLESAKEHFEDHQILVNLMKGIEIGTLKTMSQICAEILPNNPYVILSGPSHAEEVAMKLPTTLVAASTDLEVAKTIRENFSSKYLRIYSSEDVKGVELGGSLKNVIALGAGISDGLGYGDNTKAALMTRGMNEIIRLGKKLGANEETFNGLTGIGDLIVTCTSMHSRNRRCGILIGQGTSAEDAVKEIGMVVESIHTIKSAYELSKEVDVEMPILDELYNIIYKNKDPRVSVNSLMIREYKDER